MLKGQATMAAFFTPVRAKRVLLSPQDNIKDEDSRKIPRIRSTDVLEETKCGRENRPSSSPPSSPSSPPPPSCSPEQLSRIEMSRQAAKKRLLLRNKGTVVGGVGGVVGGKEVVGGNGEWEVGRAWEQVLSAEMRKDYFVKLKEFVAEERGRSTVYPAPEHVFTWTRMCEPEQVRVVILGQDPYHGPRQAHGLSFSVPKGVAPPPSLVNIFREARGPGAGRPPHGDLTAWATQGVLLLNAVLTVRCSAAASHRGRGWERLTGAALSWLNEHRTGVVFLLWGAHAQQCGACIDRKRHHVLTAPHPSPLSAHRGFVGCGHFERTNQLLLQRGLTPIDWHAS